MCFAGHRCYGGLGTGKPGRRLVAHKLHIPRKRPQALIDRHVVAARLREFEGFPGGFGVCGFVDNAAREGRPGAD